MSQLASVDTYRMSRSGFLVIWIATLLAVACGTDSLHGPARPEIRPIRRQSPSAASSLSGSLPDEEPADAELSEGMDAARFFVILVLEDLRDLRTQGDASRLERYACADGLFESQIRNILEFRARLSRGRARPSSPAHDAWVAELDRDIDRIEAELDRTRAHLQID